MLSTTNTYNTFTGNGIIRDFTYTFEILTADGADIEIWMTSPTGVVSQITTSYSIDVDTKTVTYPTVASLLSPIKTGWTLKLKRVEPLTQDKNLSPQGSIDADALEAAMDKLTAIAQQVKADVDTGVPGPTGATGENGAIGNAGDINAQDEKTSFADNDIILIEDSADGWAEKKVKKSNLGIDAVSLGGKTVGTAANNILALDGDAKLPAVDGSQLTGLPTPDSVPSGVIMPYAGATAPTGYLLCNGAAVSLTTYAALYAVIGHTYAADPGGGNFTLPDLRGRIPVGKSTDTEFDTLGETGGEKTHQLSVAEMPAHTHTERSAVNTTGNADGADGWRGNTTNTNTASGSAGSDTAHNNLQPYITINYIIKT